MIAAQTRWTPRRVTVTASGERLLTVDDVEALPDELPTGYFKYELINGRLSIGRPFTVDDVEALPDELATGPVKYELINGRLRVMSPSASYEHGAAQSNMAACFKSMGEYLGHGLACTEVGVMIQPNRRIYCIPDVMYLAKRSFPLRITKNGTWLSRPDIAVEVKSPSNTKARFARLLKSYQKIGVPVVWFLDPKAKTVTEHRIGFDPKIYESKDTLRVEDIIPGFRVKVAQLFAQPADVLQE